MKTRSTENITLSNIFGEGINILGVVFSTVLSFLITVACSVSDYTQISILLDAVQHESAFTVVIASLTLCLFLNFSLYIAGTVIKKMACGKLIGESRIISVVSIVLGFLLFAAVFTITFKFKYALRNQLFSVDNVGAVDSIINKAVKTGSELLNDNSINEEEIIRISAILSGLMPAFTSILSFLSVLLFNDPTAQEEAIIRLELLYYKYKYYITDFKRKLVNREIRHLERLPADYRDLLAEEYGNYLVQWNETEKGEMTLRTAEYTAAIELFKKDQDTVTRLSREARSIKLGSCPKPQTREAVDIPEVLRQQAKDADDLFNEQNTNEERSNSFDEQDITSHSKGMRARGEIGKQGNPDSQDNPNRDDDLMIDQDGDEPSIGTSLDRIRSINIPDSMVSPQLKEAANQ